MKFKLPEKIEGPQSWYGQEIKSSKEWIYTLTNQDIKEIESALKLVKNTDVAAIKRNNFPLASLESKLGRISDDVMNGRGFALIRYGCITLPKDCEVWWGICLGKFYDDLQ